MYKCEIQFQIVSVKTVQRILYTNGGSTTAPACAAISCHSPSASTLLDLCPAAACTVQCCLTERNKVLLYKILQNEYPLKPDVEFRDNKEGGYPSRHKVAEY